jgi:dihydropteroate synthase
VKVRNKFILQVNGKDILFGQKTWIMGILNVTPDSFSDGGLYFKKDQAVDRGLEMVAEGADIIDIGGESTRPGSDPVHAQEEAKRVVPVIKGLRKKTKALISIDTSKSEVAQKALDAGADIVNDISAFRFDPKMLPLLTRWNVPVIIMHMKGIPKSMQNAPYYDDLLSEVKDFLEERISTATSCGIKKEKIIIDPGIGFGKRFEDNLTLINNLHLLNSIKRPILIGISRKSFIGKILNQTKHARLEGTIASSVLSSANVAHILRVHDVASVKKAVKVADAILNETLSPDPADNEKEQKRIYVH